LLAPPGSDHLTGTRPLGLLLSLLALGGPGLSTSFSGMLVHLTQAATPRCAADISGVFTTSLQIAGIRAVQLTVGRSHHMPGLWVFRTPRWLARRRLGLTSGCTGLRWFGMVTTVT
jgi:hypothetical protein